MHPTTTELVTDVGGPATTGRKQSVEIPTLILRRLVALGVVIAALDGCEKPHPRPGRPIAAHAAAGMTRANQMSMPAPARDSCR
jgi:hypothetical protein